MAMPIAPFLSNNKVSKSLSPAGKKTQDTPSEKENAPMAYELIKKLTA
jgi:hypothetical protein